MAFSLTDHAEGIFRYCRARCFTSDEAEDMAQEVLLAAWTHRERIARADDPAAYLGGLCRNVCNRLIRRACRDAGNLCLPGDWDAADPDARTDAEPEYAALYARIAHLSSAYRELITRHYFHGESIRDLAKRTNAPEGTVKWRLMLARQAMKREWNDMDRSAIEPARIELMLSGSMPAQDPLPALTTPTRLLLLQTLQTPMTAIDAAERTGIPTVLVEQELEGLGAYEAVERVDGLYRTTFYIETRKEQRAIQALAEAHAAAARDALLVEMARLRPHLEGIGFATGSALDALLPCLALHLAHDGADFDGYDPPMRPDGGRYYFLCKEYEDRPQGLLIYDWYGTIDDVMYRTCAPGPQMVLDRIGAQAAQIIAACKQLHDHGTLEGIDTELVASLIAAGVMDRIDGAAVLRVPWLTYAQFERFEALGADLGKALERHVATYREQAERTLRAHMPEHLHGLVHRHGASSVFTLFASVFEDIWPHDAAAAYGLMLVDVR